MIFYFLSKTDIKTPVPTEINTSDWGEPRTINTNYSTVKNKNLIKFLSNPNWRHLLINIKDKHVVYFANIAECINSPTLIQLFTDEIVRRLDTTNAKSRYQELKTN